MPDTTPQSPLHARFESSDALLLPYGPAGRTIDVIGAFEEVGLEYAALRKSAVLFDQPHTGVLLVRGSERLAFLNNMITQKTIDLAPGQTRRSFWLSRKGRIDADLTVMAREDHLLITLDHHLAAPTAEALTNYLFSEDCTIEDATGRFSCFSLHGPAAAAILAAVAVVPALPTLDPGTNTAGTIAGVPVVIDRDDLTGDPGFTLIIPRDRTESVYDALLAKTAGVPAPKPCGWFAINTARIEAGRPLFNIDFAPDSLPAESGIIQDRVDFRKGCYLGQEVVARMDARKARKQGLAALRLDAEVSTDPSRPVPPPLPGAGDRVVSAADPEGNAVGAVTSSTISPMLSAAPVFFAMLRDAETAPGTRLVVEAEGRRVPATVQPALRFWSR
jgi:folate-binding protein YgfZ